MAKNSRLLPKSSQEPAFLIVLRILIVIAVIQIVAAMVVLAPRFVSTVAGQLAMKAKQSEQTSLLINKNRNGGAIEGTHPKNTIASKPSEKEASEEQSIISHKLISSASSTSTSNIDGVLQPGATLGIINVQHSTGPEGEQTLKIAIKARPHEVISVPDVKVQVYFYDEQDGEIAISKSPVASRWINPPVDWKDSEPELLEVTYQPDSNNLDAHYIGYIVAIYYKGELQGYRANPIKLTEQFPIKVYIGASEL